MCPNALYSAQQPPISLTTQQHKQTEKNMPTKSSLALVTGAFMFLAFWGVGLATIEIDPANTFVTADGYGVFVSSPIETR